MDVYRAGTTGALAWNPNQAAHLAKKKSSTQGPTDSVQLGGRSGNFSQNMMALKRQAAGRLNQQWAGNGSVRLPVQLAFQQASSEPKPEVKEFPSSHGPMKVQMPKAVLNRDGQVLSQDKIVKKDHFGKLHSKKLQAGNKKQPRLIGAPNYRQLDDNIHATAQPTVEGIKKVLQTAGAGPKGDKAATWTNLREEPIIYINGSPHNLRKLKRPMSNLENPGQSVEQIRETEKKLKSEILAEAKKNGGYITVHEEEGFDPITIVEKRKKLDSIQTVDEVYSDLKAQGYKVNFQRVPITDTMKPEDRDIEKMVENFQGTGKDDVMIFNCHAGKGRTTTASVIASLLKSAQGGENGKFVKNRAVREDIKEQGQGRFAWYRQILENVKAFSAVATGEKKVDEVVKEFGQVHDLRKAIANSKEHLPNKTRDFLERYNTLTAFQAYSKEQAPGYRVSFSQWKKQHPEIQGILNGLTHLRSKQ